MSILLSCLSLLVGFVAVVKGADWLVEGAASLGRRFGVSDLAIGLTVVAFGTSAPELAVNVLSSFQGAGGIVLGNILGSNIMNTALVLGVAGLVAPLAVKASLLRKEIPLSIIGGAAVYVLAVPADGVLVLGRLAGLILLTGFGLFLGAVRRAAKDVDVEGELDGIRDRTAGAAWGLTLLGCAALVLGGKLIVTSAVSMAEALGVSQALIGLTLVAVGTSIPELATSVAAAMKGKSDIAVGNVVGSNIYNIFLVLGVSALVRPAAYARSLQFDIAFYLMVSVLFWAFAAWGKRRKLGRPQAGMLLASYAGYVIYIIWRG
jgi:cation:H+ antiporter